MDNGLELAEFQQAAVRHIVARLRDARGSRRFLLADEVGLGKTIVARGVIDALATKRRSVTVLYLCSNSEIAAQNRPKLADSGGVSIGRATELALVRPETDSRVRLFAFTPGTSLKAGTGMAWERRLMMFLLDHLYTVDAPATQWRSWFRCGSERDRWMSSTRPQALHDEFSRKTTSEFKDDLRAALRRTDEGRGSIFQRIAQAVQAFDETKPNSRRERAQLLGEYRAVLQRVALRRLDPDLILLDEVQRFKDVIDHAEDERRISSELFRTNKPVLILSATPYRFLKLNHETQARGTDHHEDFFTTLGFLFHRDKKTPSRVKANLRAFGRRLQTTELSVRRDASLVDLKRKIEADLRKVMCRTERNWYSSDLQRGDVVERGISELALPTRAELSEFFDIHTGLRNQLEGVGLVTDFWKSAPSLLTFMDASYALPRKLRQQRVRVPRGLLSKASDPSLPDRNLRLRRLIRHSLGENNEMPKLWTRPSYAYYRDDIPRHYTPRKMIVFSGWRFVPKAIAVVLSNAAAARLRVRKTERRQPLRFGAKSSFHIFDVCFPSWALASLVNPRAGNAANAEPISARELVNTAERELLRQFSTIGVRVGPSGTHALWQAVARLEASNVMAGAMRAGLRAWKGSEDASGASITFHREKMLEWLHPSGPTIRISKSELRRLALIAVASPAVALLRSLLSVFPEGEVFEAMPEILRLSFGELRGYFNRPFVQQVVRLHTAAASLRKLSRGAKRGFAEKVLIYCLEHHLQAVLDEHNYLLRHAGDCSSVLRTIVHFQSVWSLGRGSRRTNTASGSGKRTQISDDPVSWPTHFALAFGDDAESEEAPTSDGEKRLRRNDIREAFNSPFWPFVLATTSVGQEGLDFHLYCRDVMHWNLPSNPVDLEQREGRVNRRDCLAVRESIVSDWPLNSIANKLEPNCNPWSAVFDTLQHAPTTQRYKHGLYPHWIYECRDASHTARIERHVAFFDGSRDSQRYRMLKNRLALYRLAFGQANQEHFLENLEERLAALPSIERERARGRLRGYMLNLSPVGAADALRVSNEEAHRLLGESGTSGLERLLADVDRILLEHSADLLGATADIVFILSHVRKAVSNGVRDSRAMRKAIVALVYLRNPYDQFFDTRAAGGFDDDIGIVAEAAKALRRWLPAGTSSF